MSCVQFTSLIQQAKQAYLLKKYDEALKLYWKLADIFGIDLLSANIKKCIRNLDGDVKISVIIPAFNVEKYISRAIKSILSQTEKRIEILVFDDCSTDSTVNLVESYRKQNSNIFLIKSKKNVGQGCGRNKALDYARGEFITFLDADDYYSDDKYFQYILEKITAQDVDIVLTPYLREKNGVIKKDKIALGRMCRSDALAKFISRDFGTHGPGSKLYNSKCIKSVKFVEFGYSQDVLFVLKSVSNASFLYSFDMCAYVYFQENNSSWRPQVLIDKHFYSSIRLLIEVICECFILIKAGDDINISSFVHTWKKDHEPRLITYLQENKECAVANYIIHLLGKFLGFFLYALDSQDLRKKLVEISKKSPSSMPKFYDGYLEYFEYQINTLSTVFESLAISRYKYREKDVVIIYISKLSSGGLERVAIQLGKSLSHLYDIVYLVDNVKNISYEYCGSVLKADLFDPEVIGILYNSKYIFDFKYKITDFEHPLCLFCVKMFSSKYVVTVHNTETCVNYFGKIKEYLNDINVNSLNSIICVSNAVKKRFEEIYGIYDNVKVVHNPIDFNEIGKSVDINFFCKKYIIFAGRLNATKHKGIDILIKAYAQSKTRRTCKLVIAGDGNFDRSITEYIYENNLSDDVIVIGFQKNIHGYMKKAEFLVAPSRWEGFSMSIIESLACGTPVLTTRVGGASEIIEHKINGYFVNTEDIDDTSNGMDYMYLHAHKMRPNCNKSVAKLSIEQYANKILDVIQGC